MEFRMVMEQGNQNEEYQAWIHDLSEGGPNNGAQWNLAAYAHVYYILWRKNRGPGPLAPPGSTTVYSCTDWKGGTKVSVQGMRVRPDVPSLEGTALPPICAGIDHLCIHHIPCHHPVLHHCQIFGIPGVNCSLSASSPEFCLWDST